MRIMICLATLLVSGCNRDGLPNNEPPADMQRCVVATQHRAVAVACPSQRPAGNCTGPAGGCQSDAACASGNNGRCQANRLGCTCSYDTCFNDGDCPKGQLCDCRRGGTLGPNACIPGNCLVDADCGQCGYCSPTLDPICGAYGGVTGYYCHTAKDTCVNDSDCAYIDAGFAKPFCGYRIEVGHWACSTAVCVG